jgi:hypothetical protein
MQIQNPNSPSILAAAATIPNLKAATDITDPPRSKLPGLDALSSGEQTQDRDANEKYSPANLNQNESLVKDQADSPETTDHNRRTTSQSANTLPVLDFETPSTYEGWG